MELMYHDDDCGELLDYTGNCPECGFSPDMQSTGFKEVSEEEVNSLRKKGYTFLGLYRKEIR